MGDSVERAGRFKSGCGCGGIDVHCHVIPARFPLPAGGTVRGWPSMVASGDCHATVVIDEKPYRQVSDACWVAERRLEEMDRSGIELQALSPMPELFGYWIEINAARDLVRHVNDAIAALVVEGKGRFVGLGGLPMQDIDLAIAELHRVVGELGFRGIEIGSNINGTAIGDPRFHPLFAEAEKLGAAVFVHAVRPAGMDRLVGPAPLQQILGYPTDVGLAAASVITGGLLQKFPKLRIAFSHGGGTFASLLPRLERGYSVFPVIGDLMPEPPSAQARRFYVDSLVFDRDMLQRLVSIFGQDRVLLGTDYPFNFREKEPVARIEEAFPDVSLRERLTFANARAFLALDEV